MPKRITIVFMLILAVISGGAAMAWAQTESAPAVNPQKIQQTVSQSIKQGQAAQSETDKALEKAQAAMDELKNKKDDLRWTAYQITKYKQYIETQKERIAELERQKQAMHEIQRALEPYLDESYAALVNLVESDLPFMREERLYRLETLAGDLGDHKLGLAEKTSRLLDVLRTENSYGLTINTQNVVLDLPKGAVNVRLLSVGRLGLYYQTEDGSQSGWYDKAAGQWRAMGAKEGKELTHAFNIVDKRSVPALVNLPVGRP